MCEAARPVARAIPGFVTPFQNWPKRWSIQNVMFTDVAGVSLRLVIAHPGALARAGNGTSGLRCAAPAVEPGCLSLRRRGQQ